PAAPEHSGSRARSPALPEPVLSGALRRLRSLPESTQISGVDGVAVVLQLITEEPRRDDERSTTTAEGHLELRDRAVIGCERSPKRLRDRRIRDPGRHLVILEEAIQGTPRPSPGEQTRRQCAPHTPR